MSSLIKLSVIAPSVYSHEKYRSKSLHICPHIKMIKIHTSNAVTLNYASEISSLLLAFFWLKINWEVKREKKTIKKDASELQNK